jgi:hypothetical protein
MQKTTLVVYYQNANKISTSNSELNGGLLKMLMSAKYKHVAKTDNPAHKVIPKLKKKKETSLFQDPVF